jgi:hypothetical protein
MNDRTRLRLAFVLSVALVSLAHAAEQVVLESNSAMYQAGRTLDGQSEIMLAAMEFVVFATEDGRFLRIAGPYMGPATGGDGAAGQPPSPSNVRRAVAQLVGARPTEASGLGGVRGDFNVDGSVADTRADPWLVHSALTGDQCVLRGRAVALWREPSDAALTAQVADVTVNNDARVQWPARETRAAWPLDAPPVDNRIYLVRPDSGIRSVAIRLHTLAPELADKDLATVAWLAARGCTAQARMLLNP